MCSLQQFLNRFCRCAPLVLVLAGSLAAQQNAVTSPVNPIRLTLTDALERARRNSVTYQAAVMEAGIAHEDKKQAIAGLLPSVNYNNSVIYSQGNGVGNPVRFIANNAVHEYISKGNVQEVLDAAGSSDARRAPAEASAPRAREEIAWEGLLVTVVGSYYAAAPAQ